MLDEYQELHPGIIYLLYFNKEFIPNDLVHNSETRKCFLIPFLDDTGRYF